MSVSVPTHESSLAIKPILSSFCMTFLPLKIPSRLILILQSTFGLPASGVSADASVRTDMLGGSLWKYHHSVAHSIRAICLVGDVGPLKSLLDGIDIDEMNTVSFCTVVRANLCDIVRFWLGSESSVGSRITDILLFLLMFSSISSTSSSVWSTTVHPGGMAE